MSVQDIWWRDSDAVMFIITLLIDRSEILTHFWVPNHCYLPLLVFHIFSYQILRLMLWVRSPCPNFRDEETEAQIAWVNEGAVTCPSLWGYPLKPLVSICNLLYIWHPLTYPITDASKVLQTCFKWEQESHGNLMYTVNLVNFMQYATNSSINETSWDLAR